MCNEGHKYINKRFPCNFLTNQRMFLRKGSANSRSTAGSPRGAGREEGRGVTVDRAPACGRDAPTVTPVWGAEVIVHTHRGPVTLSALTWTSALSFPRTCLSHRPSCLSWTFRLNVWDLFGEKDRDAAGRGCR